jgi:hypothetical protein
MRNARHSPQALQAPGVSVLAGHICSNLNYAHNDRAGRVDEE